MNAFVKKQDIGGIKKISAEDIQRSFFNEGLEDEYKTQVKSQKKSNSRERLVKKMINESEGPNFDKLYRMFTRMTEEEFVMLESVILSSNSVFNESGNIKMPSNENIKKSYNVSDQQNPFAANYELYKIGFKDGFNYYKSKC